MTIKTPASLKSFFEQGDRPSEVQFIDLIDSTYSGEIGAAIVSAASAGSTGLLQIDSASAVSFITTGSAGLAIVSAGTVASVRSILEAGSAGETVWLAGTQASARTAISAASDASASTTQAGLIEIATTAEVTTGTDATRAVTPAGHAAATVFTESFVSTEQTITAAGSLTLAHSLSNIPHLVRAELICQTAEGGYSIGDVLLASTNYIETTNFGVSFVVDATNINIRYGSNAAVFNVIQKATGAGFTITPANWTMVVRAWA